MKKKIKHIVLIHLIIILGITVSFAQNEAPPALHSIFNINVGLPQYDVLASNPTTVGLYAGLNYSYFINTRLGIDGQAELGYLEYELGGENEEGVRFLSYANLLIGVRYYLLEPRKYKYHIYTNLLVGVSTFEEIQTVIGPPYSIYTVSQSLALSAEICTVLYDRVTLGLSAEWLNRSILIIPKIGFNLIKKKQNSSIVEGIAHL